MADLFKFRQYRAHLLNALRLNLPLPPADSVPTVKQIDDMIDAANGVAKQLHGEPSAVERLQLNSPKGDED